MNSLHILNINPLVRASLVAQTVKHLLAMWETHVQSLGLEDPLKKEMATHSSTLAWKIQRTEKPVRLHSLWDHKELDMTEQLHNFTTSHQVHNLLTFPPFHRLSFHFIDYFFFCLETFFITLSEISQIEKGKYCVTSFICGL